MLALRVLLALLLAALNARTASGAELLIRNARVAHTPEEWMAAP